VRYAKAVSVYEVPFEYGESKIFIVGATHMQNGDIHNLNYIPKHDSYAISDRWNHFYQKLISSSSLSGVKLSIHESSNTTYIVT